MSPSQLNDHAHTKNGLKINKDSHLIKKSSPPSSSSSSAMAVKPQQHRHPVIIYTHSPKIIHTHPRDFMALVQKLTGLSRSDDDGPAQQAQRKAEKGDLSEDHRNNVKDEMESTSVISDENCSSGATANLVGDGNSSCFLPPIYENHHSFLGNLPLFSPNSTDFLCSNHPFYNYSDSLIYTPTIRSSISSSALEGLSEFRDF